MALLRLMMQGGRRLIHRCRRAGESYFNGKILTDRPFSAESISHPGSDHFSGNAGKESGVRFILNVEPPASTLSEGVRISGICAEWLATEHPAPRILYQSAQFFILCRHENPERIPALQSGRV